MQNPDSPTAMEQLARRARAGDAGALEALLRLARPGLMRVASQLIRDRDAAQDVVQESLLRLHINIGQLVEPAAFWVWARTILRREAYDYLRKEKRYLHEPADCYDAAFEFAADDSVGSESLRQDMDRHLRRLRQEDLNLLSLFYWREFEVAEIAGILGVAVGAVKVRLFRARNRLRDLLVESELEICSH